jgi:YD repeat-containing protein
MEELCEYDTNGNLIYSRTSDGFEWWSEYDDRGNEIHFRNSYGFESWYDYDDRGNEIHFRHSDGYEAWREYDENNKLISTRTKGEFDMETNMKNREDLTSEYAELIVDGMDMDTLVMYAIDAIRDGLRTYSDEELHDEIARFFPELLENTDA